VKSIKIIFGVLGLLLLISLAGMTYLVAYLDRHKGVLELGASKALGREIRIEEGVRLDWSLRPSIALSGLWVGNPAWAKGAYFARAEHAVVQLDLPALLRRRLAIKQVTLQNADVDLETAADGQGNWRFGGGVPSAVDTRLDGLTVQASHLRFRSASGADERLEIQALELVDASGAEPALKAELVYRDVPVTLSGTSSRGPQGGTQGWPFTARIATKTATAAISGRAITLQSFADLDVELRSDRLDLPQDLSAVWPSSTLAGALQKIAGRLHTSGATPEALIENLKGKLEIGSARLKLPAQKEGEAADLALRAASLTVEPKESVRFKGQVTRAEQTVDLELTGGALADLFWGDKPWQKIQVEAKSRFDEQPLEIAGQVGPLSALLAAQDVGVDLVVQHDGTRARIDGRLARLHELNGSRLSIDASGPSLSRLTPWLHVDLPASPPFTFAARLEASDRLLELKALKVKIGDSDLAGGLSLPVKQDGRIAGSFRSGTLDLTPFISAGGEIAADTETILEREVPPQALQGLGGDLRFQVGRLRAGDVHFDDVTLDAGVQHGYLKLALRAGEERLVANIDLEPTETDWQLTLHHRGKLDLAWLIDEAKGGGARSEAPLALDTKLSGTGRSLKGILGSADGRLEMVVGAGRLSKTAAKYLPLGSVLYTLLNTINPEAKEKREARLECAVLQLDIASGIATSTRGIALRTDTINILGGGAVKLSTGEIDLHFKTAQREVLGISAMDIADKFIRLTGTLAKPTVKVNVGELLVHGAAAWATAGLSLAADVLVTRLTAFSNPCDTVLKARAE